METLFSPAITMMNRLNYGQKFLVLGCFSLLPILAINFILYQSLNRVIVDSRRELHGLVQIEAVTQAIQRLQRASGFIDGNPRRC